MKIGNSIVFEMDNKKMMVKTLKNISFLFKYGFFSEENITITI